MKNTTKLAGRKVAVPALLLAAIFALAFAALSLTGCDDPIGGDSTAPALSEGSVSRTSHTAATIGFTSSEAGTAYYLVQNAGADDPANTEVKAGTPIGAAEEGANSKAVTLTAGAKDIYVVVEDAAGNISAPLKITAAAYSSSSGDPNCECNGAAEDCECEDCECDACDPTVTLTGITAEYTQTATVYPNTPRDNLKADLIVTATYDDDTSTPLNAADYTLSGTLAEGESVITVTYQGQEDTFTVTVTAIIAVIEGIAIPLTGATPVTTITETTQYTGTVTWNGDPVTFAFSTQYTATITLTAKTGFTFDGVAVDSFTVAGATATNPANSGVVTAAFPAPFEYIITGSGTTFTATRCGATVGTADQTIANTLTAIRTDAGGDDITIQFGDGTDVLSIGTVPAQFANSTTDTWGLITLIGKITSANTPANEGTVLIGDNVSVNSTADIANSVSNANSRALYKDGDGTVTISGGTVKVGSGRAVHNNSLAAVTINGGTVSTTNGTAVHNESTGTVTISGGRVEATIAGHAVNNNSDGLITISGTAVVTSVVSLQAGGTIQLMASNNGTSDKTRLVISGGTVENTESATNAKAVYNATPGGVEISGGTVSANGGRAIHNNSTGTLTISGNAAVSANNGSAVYNYSNGLITLSDSAAITSANTATTSGTIHLNDSKGTTPVLVINDQVTVTNTASSGNVIYNPNNAKVEDNR